MGGVAKTGRGWKKVGAEVAYRSRERKWDRAVKALNARLGGSNWALLPLSQTAAKGPCEGSAGRPFETKPGGRHSAEAGMQLPRTPLSSVLSGAGAVGKGRPSAFQIWGRWEGFLGHGGVSCLTSHIHPDPRQDFSGRCPSEHNPDSGLYPTLLYIS